MFASTESETGIAALLGPTNTGKTHRALERMLEHQSGMIGLPLRLLAREVYDRMTARIGERAVALVTGEEKRVPTHPKYWVCTVEAMPLDRQVDFLAVDEIQLGAHRERGHIFTDRLLGARGRLETWFLGSETARPLIERLVPTARIRSHPRLSQLRGTPPLGLSGLPKRSAVVAFSSQRVYELAERIARKHGGAALVLGALSPRTRNAQVALYQSGDVDYLVATDAIGMGLNLDIRHIAFADLTKFDGREARPLELAELAQIAGRAGRYLDDGTFGVLAPRAALPNGVVRALEHHHFPAELQLFWRNSQLDLSSIEALIESLRDPPRRHELRPIEPAEDHRALLALSSKPALRRAATSPEHIALLWQVCQIPDYPQLLFELHVRLLEDIFLQLTGAQQRLDSGWVDEHLRHIDRVDGDIETLMGRIADIRTWNYVSQHSDWVERAGAFHERARDIEDRLSDALHERLVARFVERRRAFALPSVATPADGRAPQKAHPFAQLLVTHGSAPLASRDPLAEQAFWTDRLIEAPHERFRLDVKGRLYFDDRRVANLLPGADLLHPDVQVRLDPDPGRGACARVRRRLQAYTRDLVEQLLAPMRQPALEELSPAARGLLYQLEQGLGTVLIADCHVQLSGLCPRDRQLLTSIGLRFGNHYLYLRRLLDPNTIGQRLGLATSHFATQLQDALRLTAAFSQVSTVPIHPALLTATGFAQAGPLILRVDRFERLVAELRSYERAESFHAPRDLTSRLGCEPEHVPQLLEALGYAWQSDGRWSRRAHKRPRYSDHERRPRGTKNDRDHSPTDSNSEA
jgi:ATP-dependent RNA helicase SUPV3L1/SUV3